MSETNGQAVNPREQLREARAKVRVARAELELKAIQKSQRLLESIGDFSRWTSAMDDRLESLSSRGGDVYIDRRHQRGGNFPLFQSEQELGLLRTASRILASTNTYAIGLTEGLASYVIADGFVYRATPKKSQDVDPRVVAAAQAVIDQHLEHNQWYGGEQPGLEEELFLRSLEDGEFFICHTTANGLTTVRCVEPEYVIQPPASDAREYSYGIRTDPDDPSTPLAYNVCWGDNPMSDCEEYAPNEIVHMRRNVRRSIKRGLPDFSFDTYDSLNAASKLCKALGIGGAIQASIVGVRKHMGATASQVQSFVETLADFSRETPYGKQRSTQKFEPGQWVDMNEGQDYVAPPSWSNVEGLLGILLAVTRSAGRRWNAPDWLISGDTTAANYATSLTAESPFVKTVLRRQRGYKAAFVRSHWIALENACAFRGGLDVPDVGLIPWADVQRWIEIQVEAPSPEVRDQLQQAQANQIRSQGGWKSRQTIMMEEGLDPDREAANMREWEEEHGPELPPLEDPGATA